MTVDALLGRIADELRPLTAGLGVEIALVVPVAPSARASPSLVAIGSPSAVTVTVSDVLRPVLVSGARQLVLVHNHPDGRAVSPADDAFTRRLVAACAVVGVELRGHVLLLPTGWIDCLGERDIVPYSTDRAGWYGWTRPTAV